MKYAFRMESLLVKLRVMKNINKKLLNNKLKYPKTLY